MLSKIKKTCIVILASILVIIPLSFNNGCRKKTTKKSTKVSQKKRQKKIEDLYKEALADIKEEKYASATTKLNEALKVDPNNKKVQAKLKEVKTLAKKKDDTAAGTTQTGGSTSEGQSASPTTGSTTTTDTPSTQTGSTSSGSSSTTSSGTTTDSSGSTQTGETEESTKDIPSDATPLSVLPEGLPNYSTASRGWITEPSQAQGRYSPADANIRKEVEMVLITAAKFERESVANAHYDGEKELFPRDSKIVKVNGHDSYFGTYAESKPELFPPSSTFVWTRGEWVFAVRIIPGGMIAADRLRDISKGLAEQVKY
ncbi:MAG: hypothetical protein HY776_08065 [Actinobacteria bacterium]|nr:hypothetical protein [Actinomycetota bacterium]